MNSDNKLKPIRDMIDQIDSEILILLSKRAQCAKEIGQLKGSAAIYRPEREIEVLNRIKNTNLGPLPHMAVMNIFRNIMSECLALEKPLTISYLGPEGTYTHIATTRHFGSAVKSIPCVSIDEAFRCAESGSCDYVVVPIENSTEGSVGRSLDLMINSPLKACGEVIVRIHLNLLSKEDDLKDINTIYAHSQALAQSHEWLSKHLANTVKIIPVSSNAEAARIASTTKKSAAIASVEAAKIYQLNILFPNIEDEPNNTTRFLVLGKQDTNPSKKDKTSLIASTKNQPGAIFKIIEPFFKNGIDMTKLESRPSKTGLWEYHFFIDIKGHIKEENVRKTLDDLKDNTSYIKVIGSYPESIY